MTHPPPEELLEATHQFPCKFTFKAIGKNNNDFPERVVATIRSELAHEFDSPFELKHTTHGRHVSITIEPIVETARQVLAIYDRLKSLDGLVILL